LPRLAPDGTGGAIVCWKDDTFGAWARRGEGGGGPPGGGQRDPVGGGGGIHTAVGGGGTRGGVGPPAPPIQGWRNGRPSCAWGSSRPPTSSRSPATAPVVGSRSGRTGGSRPATVISSRESSRHPAWPSGTPMVCPCARHSGARKGGTRSFP